MPGSQQPETRRVLIASSHALFGQGLRSLLEERKQAGVIVVGMVFNLEQAVEALEKLNPDLIIVDYDDEVLNRDEFLARFVEGQRKLRVVLLSLQSGKEAIVYDRRSLAAAQIDDWLDEWEVSGELPSGETTAKQASARLLQDGVNPQAKNRRSNMKHFIAVGILVIAVTAVLILGLGYARLLPVAASAQAVPIDNLFHLEFMIIAFLFSLIVVMILYSIVVFRRKKGDLSDARHIEGHTGLEVTWTIAPLITVMALAYLGSSALSDTLRADPTPLRINVIGQQWSWRFEYPELGIVSDTLMMPVNRQALLRLSSQDVIHSFWVPEFRVKQDALPGDKNFIRDLRVTPTIEGVYKLRCAELCGLNHTTMISDVKVVPQEEFDAWVQTNKPAEDPVARGEQLVKTYGCLACHSVDGSKLVGPSWKGVYGTQETLSDGATVTVNDEYLKNSIIDPASQLVQGYANLMPATFASQLTPEEIDFIIAYIQSLK